MDLHASRRPSSPAQCLEWPPPPGLAIARPWAEFTCGSGNTCISPRLLHNARTLLAILAAAVAAIVAFNVLTREYSDSRPPSDRTGGRDKALTHGASAIGRLWDRGAHVARDTGHREAIVTILVPDYGHI